ncbi:MAG: TlpA family protein disulfide reductase [Acidobacteria bacterium]|nr:TlpA family protein disulfide reductase [Acidobacteriota bacterium]
MKTEKLVVSIQAAAALLLVGISFLVADSLRERLVSVGDSAPRFQVTTDAGRHISTSDFGGKILVVNFWATWCPPCVDEMPSLQAMAKQFEGRGVVVLGVSVDKNEANYKRFLQQAGISFPTARDPEADISAEYGTFKYPETYVIDQQGKVRQKHIGPRNWMDPELVKSIADLL